MNKKLSFAAGLLSVAGALWAGSASAATITVDSFLDNGVNCTLRKAIENANAGGSIHGACTAGTSSNTIVLGTGTYLFTASPNGPLNLVNNNITIQGNGPALTVIDGQNQDFIFDNFDNGGQVTAITITFTGLTIRNGHSPGFSGFDVAGAMFVEVGSTAVINDVTFSNNSTTASGGAIANYGTMTISNSTFSGNTGNNTGGAGEGGAIRNAGTLTVTNSTFNGNSASSGGAIYHTGDVAGESLSITNSTFSGNSAGTRGGAIAANNSASLGPITLTHVTIANNTVTGGSGTGGGIYKNQSASFSIDRSIIANNTATNGPDCNGTSSFNSLDYNVLSSTTGCGLIGTTTNNFVGALTLGALANNGGPTQTIALPSGNPARDRAPTCATPTDQRGSARPQGSACDSGAFEVALTAPGTPTIGALTAGVLSVSLGFSPPADNGGSPITGYTVACTPGGGNSGAGSPITVSGLTAGTPYTCTVTATNAYGTSGPSAASNSATPTAPVAGVRSGFNGDARSDVLWRDSTGGLVYQWQMNGLVISAQGYMSSVPSSWMVAGVGDASGDGIADVLWRQSGGLNYLWIVSSLGITSQGYMPSVPNPWIVVGLGDADGDGKADVFWRNPTSGQNYLWIMNGLSVASQAYLPTVAGADWEAVGLADYSGDGKADVLWRHKTSGQNYLWVMNGLVIASQGFLPTVTPTDWEVVASPDADGDGKADVFWRNKVTGTNHLWLMNGLAIASQGAMPGVADTNWKVVGFGDYNGDGRGDVLWRNAATGQNYVWMLNGLVISSQGALPVVSGSNWMPVK